MSENNGNRLGGEKYLGTQYPKPRMWVMLLMTALTIVVGGPNSFEKWQEAAVGIYQTVANLDPGVKSVAALGFLALIWGNWWRSRRLWKRSRELPIKKRPIPWARVRTQAAKWGKASLLLLAALGIGVGLCWMWWSGVGNVPEPLAIKAPDGTIRVQWHNGSLQAVLTDGSDRSLEYSDFEGLFYTAGAVALDQTKGLVSIQPASDPIGHFLALLLTLVGLAVSCFSGVLAWEIATERHIC